MSPPSSAPPQRPSPPLRRHGRGRPWARWLFPFALATGLTVPTANAERAVKARDWTQIGGIPRVVAHRGGSSAPENTLAAYRAAIGRGDRAVECDVHMSSDGVPVVIHDPSLARTTNGDGRVSWRSARSLRRLNAGGWYAEHFESEGVPTLEEVLDVARDRAVVFVELKRGRGLVKAVQRLLDARPEQRDQVLFLSFEPRLLRQAARAMPDVPRMLLMRRGSKYGRRMVNQARWARATMIGLDFESVTARDIRLAHRRRLPVYAYTVNDVPRVANLVRMGIDGLITDRPFETTEASANEAREYAARP